MRILIADDENLTRAGLISSINWHSLPFDQIDQADDGVNALQLAKTHLPDVLLTDIRMPRMNGIELAERIQELNPNCSIIFMSGYSDKEYLMAAIKLRAVRYVEKPINPVEVMEALTESVNTILQTQVHIKSKALLSKEAAAKFALNLSRKGYDLRTDASIDEANLRGMIHSSTFFTTFIIKIFPNMNTSAEDIISSSLEDIYSLIEKKHLQKLHFIKNDSILVLHIFGNERPEDTALLKLGKDIKSLLPVEVNFFLAIGKTVSGPEKVYLSYNSAVILLQSSFFYEYGSILTQDRSLETLTNNYPYEFADKFNEAIINENVSFAYELAESFFLNLQHNHSLLANTIKDVYYKLFLQINSIQYKRKLQTESSAMDSKSLLESISGCNILSELHQLLLDKIADFEKILQAAQLDNSTIFLIRDYISKHYSDYTLSIKDISEHVHLSSSYLCTVFKTETGKTLNQYLTDFRLEKAKQLLSDPRNKISEISSRVGYSDGNYFGKCFKKEVGLSPSEYREKASH